MGLTIAVDGLRQAAQLLRTHVVSLPEADRADQLSVIASLLYADRLNDPPIHPDDPDAIGEVCQRFSDIIADHLHLATLLLVYAARVQGVAPHRLFDEIVHRQLGGYQ